MAERPNAAKGGTAGGAAYRVSSVRVRPGAPFNEEAVMSKEDPHRIEDVDLYVFLGILCYALNSPVCGGISLAIAGYICLCSSGDSSES